MPAQFPDGVCPLGVPRAPPLLGLGTRRTWPTVPRPSAPCQRHGRPDLAPFDCSTGNGSRRRLLVSAWAAVGGRGRGIPASPEPAVGTPGHGAAARRWSAAATLRWAPGRPSLRYWREAQAGWLAEVIILPENPRQLPAVLNRSPLDGRAMVGTTCQPGKLGEFPGNDSMKLVECGLRWPGCSVHVFRCA